MYIQYMHTHTDIYIYTYNYIHVFNCIHVYMYHEYQETSYQDAEAMRELLKDAEEGEDRNSVPEAGR